MRMDVRSTCAAVTATTAAVLLACAAPAAADTAAPGTGSAYGASVSVTLLPGVLGHLPGRLPGGAGRTLHTGRLAPSSTAGPTEASVLDVPLRPVVTARAITSSARHDPATGVVRATAAVLDARLPVLATATGRTPGASVLRAECRSGANGVTGGSTIAELDLGRLGTVPVNGTPNQTVELPGVLRVVLNEQTRHADGSLTVTALHVYLLGGSATAALGSGDIVLASATCGLGKAVHTTVPTTPPAHTPPVVHPGGHQVGEVPVGAPQTGDGSLAGSR